jgi:RNA polymerase sigma factor (sigma-70 family)
MDATLSFYMDGLYGYAMVLTGDATVAADLVQETYVRAMEPMGRLREDSNVKAWLYTILRNIGLNQVRRQRTGPRLLAGENTADLVIETAQRPSRALFKQSGSRASARSDHAASSGVPRDHSIARVWGAFLSRDRHLAALPAWDCHVTPGKSALQTPNLTSHYRPFIADPSSPPWPSLLGQGENDGDTSI